MTVAAADAAPTAGVTVVAAGTGATVTASAAAVLGTTFVVRVPWDGVAVRRSVTSSCDVGRRPPRGR